MSNIILDICINTICRKTHHQFYEYGGELELATCLSDDKTSCPRCTGWLQQCAWKLWPLQLRARQLQTKRDDQFGRKQQRKQHPLVQISWMSLDLQKNWNKIKIKIKKITRNECDMVVLEKEINSAAIPRQRWVMKSLKTKGANDWFCITCAQVKLSLSMHLCVCFYFILFFFFSITNIYNIHTCGIFVQVHVYYYAVYIWSILVDLYLIRQGIQMLLQREAHSI